MSDNKKSKNLKVYARYSGMAFQMIAIILIGVFGGKKIDEWLQFENPVFLIILTILSVILAVYYVIKDLLKVNK